MRAVISGPWAGLMAMAAATTAVAQPASPPNFARAKELYDQASRELTQGQFEDAARDFGAAYAITQDPVLFFKIASANDQAGKCDVALVYYRRYLHEGHPSAKFLAVTTERMRACGAPAEGAPAAGGDAGSGSATPIATGPAPVPRGAPGRDAAWLLVGGSLAFVTAGAVLAYSASSSEQDLKDLYVGLSGTPPVFDATTRARYQELVDEGHRYEYLSWGSFGVAAGCAIGAAILFARSGHPAAERHAISPVVTPHGGGIAVRF